MSPLDELGLSRLDSESGEVFVTAGQQAPVTWGATACAHVWLLRAAVRLAVGGEVVSITRCGSETFVEHFLWSTWIAEEVPRVR